MELKINQHALSIFKSLACLFFLQVCPEGFAIQIMWTSTKDTISPQACLTSQTSGAWEGALSG